MNKINKLPISVNSKYEAKQRKAMENKANLENFKENLKETENASKKITKKDYIDNLITKFGKPTIDIALLIRNNAEIRRFTSLAIINYLTQKGEIKGDAKYVQFKWNKFAVKSGGLTKEFFYTEKFFINAFVASFISVSNFASKIIGIFCAKEMNVNSAEYVDDDEITSMSDFIINKVENIEVLEEVSEEE